MSYNIDCVIDTNPMAREINTVSNNIQGTTSAVVGMRAAVVAAEQEAAQRVCENVNKGFYTLIRSQISQKMAALQSEVDSHLMKLNQLRKQLLNIKSRMEHDYEMITNRYIKLFGGLNKSLQQRVYELDKPTIEFAVRDTNTITNRSRLLTATVPVAQTEALAISQKILASNMKYQGMKVINSMKSFLHDYNEQKLLSEKTLLPADGATADRPIMLPIIIHESCIDNFGNCATNIVMNRTLLSPSKAEMVNEAATNFALGSEWQASPLPDEVKVAFCNLLAADNIPERVKQTANKLFSECRAQTIKNQRI